MPASSPSHEAPCPPPRLARVRRKFAQASAKLNEERLNEEEMTKVHGSAVLRYAIAPSE